MPFFVCAVPGAKPVEEQRFEPFASQPAGALGERFAIGLQGGRRTEAPAPAADEGRQQVPLGDRRVLEVVAGQERKTRKSPYRPAEQAGVFARGDGSARGAPPGGKLGLPGGADRPPGTAEQPSDFFTIIRRLRDLKVHYYRAQDMTVVSRINAGISRISRKTIGYLEEFGGKANASKCPGRSFTRGDRAYEDLRCMAETADKANDPTRAHAIRETLREIDAYAANNFKRLTGPLNLKGTQFDPAMHTLPATVGPGVAPGPSTSELPSAAVAAAAPLPSAPQQTGWLAAYRQLRALRTRYMEAGMPGVAGVIDREIKNANNHVLLGFGRYGGTPEQLKQFSDPALTASERRCLVLQDMAENAEHVVHADAIRRLLESATAALREVLDDLAGHEAVNAASFTQAAQIPPATSVPAVTAWRPAATTSPQTVGVVPPRMGTPELSDWSAEYCRLLNFMRHCNETLGSRAEFIAEKIRTFKSRIWKGFRNLGGTNEHVDAYGDTMLDGVQKRCFALKDLLRDSDYAPRAPAILRFLEDVRTTTRKLLKLVVEPQAAVDCPSVQPVWTSPGATGLPGTAQWPVVGRQTAAVPPGAWRGREPQRYTTIETHLPPRGVADSVLPTPDFEGPVPATSFPELVGMQSAGREVEEFRHGLTARSAMGTTFARTAVPPAATEVAPMPGLGTVPPFWLQPVDPVPAPGTVPFDYGPHRTGEPTHAPPLTAEPGPAQPQAMRCPGRPMLPEPWTVPPEPGSALANAGLVRALPISTEFPTGWQSTGAPGFGLGTLARPLCLPRELREEIVYRFMNEDEMVRAEAAVHRGGVDRFGRPDAQCRRVLDELRQLHYIASMDPAAAVTMRGFDWPALKVLKDFVDRFPS